MPEVKTYVGETATTAFDGYAGLRIGRRYTGTEQEDGKVLIAAVGAMPGSGVKLEAAQWQRWFKA
jgi:hypothetical protein